ncbi:MAG: folylpolyglutamate synthase/dihydrofolate synthase family protein [Elusimicrobiota bacterium]
MTYRQALCLLEERQEVRWKLGLSRIRGLLRALGDPQDAAPAIHVAGTNGKGGLCAMLEAILRSAGYRVGLYTSPHLVRPTERIRFDGREISPGDFGRLVGTAQKAETGEASFFELLTAAAFLYFRERGADIAVIEVGMGGRLDATNVLRKPLLTAIPSIGFDHTTHLGTTLSAIAREKAGILKAGSLCLCGDLPPEAAGVIRRRARAVGCPVEFVRRGLRSVQSIWEEGRQELADGGRGLLSLPLLGDAAVRNASIARRAAERLRVPEDAVRRGLSGFRWPGRFQVLRTRGRTLILDGAHNPPALEAFVSTWRKSPWHRGDAVFMVGCLQDKDCGGLVRILSRAARKVILARPDSPRALDPAALAPLFEREGVRVLGVERSADRALAAWVRTGAPVGAVCGSLYLVGNVLKSLENP